MSESLIQKQADVQGLSTAILLPSVDLFGAPDRNTVSPLTQIVGIGLFARTVLTLQRSGIRQLIVLVGSEEEQLKQALAKGPRVTIPVRWMPIREFPLDDHRTWEALAAEAHGFCLLSGVGGVFSRPLIEQLRQDVQNGQAIVVAQGSRASSAQLPSFGWKQDTSEDPVPADLIVLPISVLSGTTQETPEPGLLPVHRWLERASSDGRLRVMTVGRDSGAWYQDVRSVEDIRRAERRLYSSLKGEFEGFVDRYFNRKLSRWFTRGFVAMGLSPNAITVVATVIGLAAAGLFGVGTYAGGIAAALLFQFAAVIDCCDGEVARLTFTESPFGAWLDIAMDNVVHMAIFGGIAVGTFLHAGVSERSWIPLALGAAAILGNALSFTLVNRAQRIKQASEWKTPVHAAWSDFMLKNVASRDFSVVVLIFALLGKLDWFLWMAALGSIVFALIMVWVIRPSAMATKS